MSNDSDYEMFDLQKPSTSKVAELSLLPNKNTSDDVSLDDVEDPEHQEESTLWSIDDDTMFFAQGLKNHSAGKGKSVFVTWNENYLLNFVFKSSSKSRKTTLTKVRLPMPWNENGEPEEIADMLILEFNTLLLMKSGNVYYFSSVKSIHPVTWLKRVRCVAACPRTQFSVIRFQDNCEKTETPKQLLLEVYQDIAQLGKCPKQSEALRHSYDISFDLRNVFNCDWHDERYVILSLMANQDNIEFLQKLLAIANCLIPEEERSEIVINQEVHFFTVSGNLFMLAGAEITDKETFSKPNVEDYSIHLLNTYATNIECLQIDVSKNLLMVLLESGHLDVWYQSQQILQNIHHLSHELSYFTYYDYDACENTFYITTPEEVTQIQVINGKDISSTFNECRIHEQHKAIGGMVACTWVESLQQLVCLSYNNIFYKLHFHRKFNDDDNFKEVNYKYENYQVLYALTTNKIKDLLTKAQVVNDLKELPQQLHNDIEIEYQKQQMLALAYKRRLWQKILKSHLEYHKTIPSELSNDKDLIVIKTLFHSPKLAEDETTMYALIFMNPKQNDSAPFLSAIKTSVWYLDIFTLNTNESLLLHLPAEIITKRLCFIISYAAGNYKNLLPDFTINLRTFIHHNSQYVSLTIDIEVEKNEKTYRHIFNHGAQQLVLFPKNHLNPDFLLKTFKQKNFRGGTVPNSKSPIIQVLKLEIAAFKKILEVFSIKYDNLLNTIDFTLYFLQLHPLYLNYDESKHILTITTEHIGALFYFKIFLMYELQYSGDEESSATAGQLKIMQLQGEVERIYGSLLSSTESMEADSGTISLHLENLQKVYSTLRSQFNDILR